MRAMFFDIDGTLVSFNTHKIPQSTIDALRKAREAGNKVIISTGRPSAIITNLRQLQDEKLIDGYITMNGSYCFVNDKVLYKSAIPHAEAVYLAKVCNEKKVPCIFVGEKSMTIAGENLETIEIFSRQLDAPPIPLTDYTMPTLHPLLQLTPFFDEASQLEIEKNMPGSEFGRWHPAFVDITARGNNKAHGMDIMLEYFGISIADTIAFGDGGNDIPMIQHAAIGVAMGNANDNVKESADYVTSSVDDNGIANALVKFGII